MTRLTFTTVFSDAQLEQARSMTFPAYAGYLQSSDRHIALAAMEGETVVGLALWQKDLRDERAARLLSLLVKSERRRQGIAADLLAASFEMLGFRKAAAYWSSSLSSAAAFENLLMKTGWAEKELDQCRVSGTAQGARDWAYRRRMDRMLSRPGWVFKAFDEIGPDEQAEITAAAIAEGVEESWLPFAPVGLAQAMVPSLSIVMRQHGNVAGWLTTCRADNGDIWYYRLHNAGANKSSGALMPLIVEVNRRHLLLDGPEARWRWNTGSQRPDMLAFLARHAPEFCDFHDYHWTSSIVLSTEADNVVGEEQQVASVG